MSLHPEQVDHINLVNWFHHSYPELADDFHHIANERKCSLMQGRLLKRMGVKAGVLDFHLAIPSKIYHGLWLELKVGKGKLSKDQISFIERKNARGYFATMANGFEHSKQIINSYLEYIKD